MSNKSALLDVPRHDHRPAIAVLLVICLTGSSPAWAASYYLAQDGNDKNSGASWAQAWKTLAHAGEQVTAGDEVIIRKGSRPYYGHLPVKNSGKPGKPITFRGENATDPPVITGAIQITDWIATDKRHVWKSVDHPPVTRLVENNIPLPPASDTACNDGRWYWSSNRTLYYRPATRTPAEHEIWVPRSGGGILIGENSWIVIQDIYAWLGNGAGVSIKYGHHNIIRRFRAKWHWRGVNIHGNAHDNLVEHCLVEENREGIYLLRGAYNNRIRSCRAFRNGNASLWQNGDRAGIAIGEKGPNVGNIVEDSEIAYNGGPNSDPAMIAYHAPETQLLRNHVHDNFGSGIFVTIGSNASRIIGNIVERNGYSAVEGGYKGIAGLSVRSSYDVLVDGNKVIDNWVAPDSPWPGKGMGPKGGLDLQGLPRQNMRDIVFTNNQVYGTKGGPDIYISPHPSTEGIILDPLTPPQNPADSSAVPEPPSAPADATAQ